MSAGNREHLNRWKIRITDKKEGHLFGPKQKQDKHQSYPPHLNGENKD